jgi:FHS family L-fucose permease-like MFS transporter
LFGGAAIFLYVGAEVSINTRMALFLNGDNIWGIPLQDAGKLVLYWGGAMVGRLIGSALLTRVPAPKRLRRSRAWQAPCLYIFSVGGGVLGMSRSRSGCSTRSCSR